MRNIAFLFVFVFAFIFLTRTNAEGVKMPTAMIYTGPGTSEKSVDEIRKALSEIGIITILLKEGISSHALAGADILIFPGGWAPDYKEKITEEGIIAIRKFVFDGGVYVGICAGAYFAASEVLWEEKEYKYPLGLFKGKVVGPLFPNWKQERLIPIRIKRDDKTILVSYIGGPFFLPENNSSVILAEYIGGRADRKPASLISTYGSGRVFLSGPHLEYSVRELFKAFLRPLLRGR